MEDVANSAIQEYLNNHALFSTCYVNERDHEGGEDMALLEMKERDLKDLYVLLNLYSYTYGESEAARTLIQEVSSRCRDRGIKPDAGNSRGAGRKRKYTEEQNRQILVMHAVGITIRDIAAEIGCSAGYVQKIINERIGEQEWY